MRFQKVIILLFVISLIGIPQIACAQTYEQLIQQGKKAVSNEDFVKAEAIWREAIRRNPKDSSVWTYLGRTLRLQEKLEEAHDVYEKAIKLNSQNSYAHNGLGNVLSEQGKFDKALEAYRKAIELNPREPEFKNNLNELQRYLALKRQNQEHQNYTQSYTQQQTQGTTITTSSNGSNVTINVNGQPIGLNDLSRKPLPPPLASVVKIVTKNSLGGGPGTGWVLTRQENTLYIITNRHVVVDEINSKPSEDIRVEFYSSSAIRKSYPAKITNITTKDNPLDLAVLEVKDAPFGDIQPLPISDKKVSYDTQVRVIGHPNSFQALDWTVETGEISNIADKQLQLSKVTLYPGNSGSPVLDDRNHVVGVVFAITLDTPQGKTGTAGFGFAYPIELVKNQLRIWGYGL